MHKIADKLENIRVATMPFPKFVGPAPASLDMYAVIGQHIILHNMSNTWCEVLRLNI